MKILDLVHARGRGVSTHQPRKKMSPFGGFSFCTEEEPTAWLSKGIERFFVVEFMRPKNTRISMTQVSSDQRGVGPEQYPYFED